MVPLQLLSVAIVDSYGRFVEVQKFEAIRIGLDLVANLCGVALLEVVETLSV